MLTASDLELSGEKPKPEPPPSLQHLNNQHHGLARLASSPSLPTVGLLMVVCAARACSGSSLVGATTLSGQLAGKGGTPTGVSQSHQGVETILFASSCQLDT